MGIDRSGEKINPGSNMAFEMRVAGALVGTRRAVTNRIMETIKTVGVGVGADLAALTGLELEEGPLLRAQRRLAAGLSARPKRWS